MTKYRKILFTDQVLLMPPTDSAQLCGHVSFLLFASKDISRLHDLL